MNNQEANEILQRDLEILIENKSLPDGIEAMKVAISALGAIGQYKWELDVAISQLEELGLSLGQKVDHVKEAIDKQVIKDVIAEKYFYGENYYCPCCRNYLGADHNNLKDVKYCDKCGQKINIKQK